MTLLVDMGNSRMKVAESTKVDDVYTLSYGDASAVNCLVSYLEQQSTLTSIALVSVLGEQFEKDIKQYCTDKNVELTWVTSTKAAQGINNYYDKPSALGSDRFVALVGAIKQFPSQYCIVVDCGTAVTIDSLTAEGEFQGGVILPGLQLWGQSLIGRTSQLDENNLVSPELLAKNTADAIGAGSVYGLVGAVDGICLRMKQRFIEGGADSSSVRLVLCGGDAALVASHSQLDFTVLPHLVLMGLAQYI
jgi:type III pantothenate kinase